jgi:hypothetical protein
MNTANIKQINKFFNTFLENNKSESLVSEWLQKTNQNRLKTVLNKKVKVKDPNAPKRGKSAYLFFCEKYRGHVKDTMGENVKATEVTCELGKNWNEMKTDKSRVKEIKQLEAMAKKDKERYQSEKDKYTPPVDIKKSNNLKGPKRTKSAYLFFCQDKRSNVKDSLGENVKATEVTRELGKLWNEAKANKKIDKYEKQAAKDKERYQKEKEKFSQNVETQVVEEEVLQEEDEIVEGDVAVAKQKRKPNGYQVFCSTHRSEYKKRFSQSKPLEITKKLSVAWKKLSDDDKKVYKN